MTTNTELRDALNDAINSFVNRIVEPYNARLDDLAARLKKMEDETVVTKEMVDHMISDGLDNYNPTDHPRFEDTVTDKVNDAINDSVTLYDAMRDFINDKVSVAISARR